MTNQKTKKAVFDVDGTLITADGAANATPRYEVIDLFRNLRDLGYKMYIHSGSGVDYAKRWRDKLGLEAEVKPKGCDISYDVVVDDMVSTAIGKEGVNALAGIQV